MSGQATNYRRFLEVASFWAIISALIVILAGCGKQPAEQADTENRNNVSTQSETMTKSTNQPVIKDNEPAVFRKLNLNEVIKSRQHWDPAFTSWYGKMAPDFLLTDINGEKHRLSDYRGKDVMIIFWATWCRPCIIEIPHLIALRNTVENDELAMLAISNESRALVKEFVAASNMNYTVVLDEGTLPTPFNLVDAVPCSFFIDPEGKIKLATVGILSLGAIKAILRAKGP